MRFFRRRGQRGQSLVEFTMVIPIIMTMALTIAEFGVAFGTNMSLIEATREGARVGAVLVNGSNSFGCPGSPGAANVDPQIVASVQRVIESPGSGVTLANVDWVRIYKADATGNPIAGTTNEWRLKLSTDSATAVCGVNLDFVPSSTGSWTAASRNSTLPVSSIGVSIEYRYRLFTPLSALTGLIGLNTITMVDSTTMALEP
jgi:Flp pilus assembly protein TadG